MGIYGTLILQKEELTVRMIRMVSETVKIAN
jgi:hypothetical protein